MCYHILNMKNKGLFLALLSIPILFLGYVFVFFSLNEGNQAKNAQEVSPIFNKAYADIPPVVSAPEGCEAAGGCCS